MMHQFYIFIVNKEITNTSKVKFLVYQNKLAP